MNSNKDIMKSAIIFVGKNRTRLVLIVIFLLGIFLRLYNFEQKVRFIWDEGRDMMAIRHMLIEKDLTLFGPFNEIDGKKDFFGVFHYYLMAPSLYFANYDPIGPALFTALLGIISMPLFYLLLKLLMGEKYLSSVLLATLMYSLSPLVVRYVQWPWNPNTTPFFSLIFLYSTLTSIKYQKSIWSLISGLTLGLLFQLHYFTFPLLLVWIVGKLTNKSKFKLLEFALFIIGFMLPNLSFVIFDFTHEFFYWDIIKESLTKSGKQGLILGSLFTVFASPITVTVEAFTALMGRSKLFGIMSSILFFAATISAFKNDEFKKVPLLIPMIFSWTFFCLLAGLAPQLVDEYYYLPYAFILLSVPVVFLNMFLPKKLNRSLTLVTGISLLIIFVFKNEPFRMSNWNEQLASVRYIGREIARDANHIKFNIASLVDSDTRATRFRYFVERYGETPLSVYDYEQAETLYVVVHNLETDFADNPAWELESFMQSQPFLIAQHGAYLLYRFDKK